MFQCKFPFPVFPSPLANQHFTMAVHNDWKTLSKDLLLATQPPAQFYCQQIYPSDSQTSAFPPLSPYMLSFLHPSIWHFNYLLFQDYKHLESKPYLALKMELDCPVHSPPLGSPQGCFHFRYSPVSCSEALCWSHWQIGLTAGAAVSKHKTATVQKVFTWWHLSFALCPAPVTWAMKFLLKAFLSVSNKFVSGLPVFSRHQVSPG